MRIHGAASFTVLALVACGTLTEPHISSDTSMKGFVCTTFPSDAYGPGYVYRVDETGGDFYVRLLDQTAETLKSRLANRTVTARVTKGGDFKLELMGPLGALADAGVEGSASAGTDSLVSFTDGTWLQLSDDAATALVAAATNGLTPVPGSTYYVVRDAVQAGTIKIVLSASDTGAFGGSAKVEAAVAGSAKVSQDASKAVTVEGTYDPPLNVCLRAVRLEPVDTGEPQVVGGPSPWKLTDEVAPARSLARVLARQ